MLNTETLALDAATLAASLAGDVVAPGDKEYDLARRAWNLAVDQRPALVAFPADAADVMAIVDFARARGLRVAPQGTGHNAGPLPALDDVVLVNTQRMRGVEIDAEARSARVAAGTQWIEVTSAASEVGLAPLSGSSPDVGVVGYTLGGGLSWLARKHGLASNSVTAIEVVTGDGRLVRATAEDEPDLFWALRGGGGNFGVVTAMEFRLYVVPTVFAGMMLWPVERAAEVLEAWRVWTGTAPEEATTSARILHVPPLPDLPEFIRGRSVVVIDGAILGAYEDAVELMAPLRALAPEIDTFGLVPPVALSRIHMDPEDPVPAMGHGELLGTLDADAIAAWVESASAPTALLMAEVRHLGGAVGREPEGAGATGKLDGEYVWFACGMAPFPEAAAAVHADLERFTAALAPWGSGGHYMNFAERRVDPATIYAADDLARLRAIRADVDPLETFMGNHAL